MQITYAVWICACMMLQGYSGAFALTIEEVVRRAGDRARQSESMKLAVLSSSEEYLEAQSKFRFELRPRLAMFAFTNPALLASSIGAGMLLGRTPPSPWARQQARLDRISAEIAAQRAIASAEREALRAYFQLTIRQKTRDTLRNIWEDRRQELVRVEERVRKARLTAADLAGYRSNLLEWELQLEQADYECSLAALELGKLLGLTDAPSHLHAAEFPIPGKAAAIPSTGALYQLAFRQSNSYSDLRAKVEAEKRSLLAGRRIQAPDLSLAYANTADRAGSKLGLGSGGYLLGGHSGSLDLGIRISLRPTGEGAALANAAASRIATLEYELTRLDEEARWEIDALRLLAVSSRRRAELAEHKLQIAEAAFHVAARRERAGLASRDTVVAAEFQITRLRAEHRQARSEHDARFAQLVAATRLDWNAPDLSRTLLAVAANTSEVDHVE